MTLTAELLRFVRQAGVERSPRRILAAMSRFIARTFDVHRVSVYIYEDGALRPLASEYANDDPRPDLWQAFQQIDDLSDLPLARRMRHSGTRVLMGDPGQDDGFRPDQVEQFDIRPYLAVALRDDDAPMGIVLIEGDPEELRAQADQLEDLAGFVELAVHNLRAFARERQRAREAEALVDVAAVLTRHTDLTPVLASVALNSARATGFDRASIFLLDDSGTLRPTMSQFADGHVDGEAWDMFVSRQGEIPACRAVIDTGRPLWIRNVAEEPAMVTPEWTEPFGLRSMLVIPLIAWDQTFGALVLDHRHLRSITPEQTRIAQGVAAHGAVAIGLARLLASERAAKERLAELDRLKTAFIATVSHELRTPLTTIVGFTRILPDLVEGEAREFVDLINRESMHLESLIGNLLDTSRLEAGLLDIQRRPVDFTAVVEEATDLIRYVHPDASIDCDVDRNLTMEAGDEARLRQVVVNLLENACKYGGQKIRVGARSVPGGVRLDVDDSGPGIPDDHREEVFARFHRLHEGQGSGTGIGLYLVRALVEAHGGRVWIDASPTLGGCRFVAELPSGAGSTVINSGPALARS